MVETILPLKLEHVIVRKRSKTLLGPLDLVIETDGTTIIMGPNGSGKTTLLRLMHGLEKLSEGQCEWNCADAYARNRQAFVFQNPILLRRTAIENVIFPLRLQKKTPEDAKGIALSWLEKVGMTGVVNLEAARLSGGEKQKLALIRALACEPQVLFLDEPTASLDGASTREIESLLREAIEKGLKVVMATHDLGQARRLADEVIFLHHGQLQEQTSAGKFFAKPKTAAAENFIRGEIVE